MKQAAELPGGAQFIRLERRAVAVNRYAAKLISMIFVAWTDVILFVSFGFLLRRAGDDSRPQVSMPLAA
ncbi:hypothetical protein PQR62_02835 [Herbaspirillum lusitanum]|uniref:RDD domain-containing protein n=1 Tax=Herbaspirillum lusitanum TaxID=213312 RepID=A0ABW9A5B9_9BURK